MTHWTLNDIAWDRIECDKVGPDLLAVVKAASLVERNAGDYVTYLCQVFDDDPAFREAAHSWGLEEIQHGEALGRWSERVDPRFDFARSFQEFLNGYRLPLDSEDSVRGSRTGELIARCVVESGTSSFYSALRDATEEPVLRSICHRIAGDEFRHYKMFYTHLQRYLDKEKPWLVERVMVAIGRYRETEDDELAFAYHCANHLGEPYDRERAGSAYYSRAFPYYRREHMDRAIGMIAKATGIRRGRLVDLASRVAWTYTQRQIRQRRAA
jgi:hypothetical protein